MFSLRSLKLASSLLPRHSTRLAVASFSSSKKPLHFELPDALANIGSKVFDFNTLEPATLRAYKRAVTEGTPLEDKYKDKLAQAIQNWALSKGAVNCSHWFSALRGTNAEKHDSMIEMDFSKGDIRVEMSAGRLFQGETDGSSFPNGGLRATHRAAAYTGWDMTSPPFIRGDTVFLPAAFITYHGEPLDDKTPLLRSQDAINKQGLRLLRALGDTKSTRVVSNVGWEQEFFVIDREMYQQRPDLIATGRTLLGALPHRGQQTEAHYFARPPLRIRAMLREAQSQMWSLGLSMNTYHNEVAPSQHEMSPIFTLASVAADQNTVAMEVLNECAARHGLAVLTHEKPFARINGSGKHNNWGLNTDTGANLFVPGKSAEDQKRFMTFVAALTHAVNVHGDALRIGVASAGNDHRLGAQEAPPAIISLYTGELMEAHIRNIIKGGPLDGYTKDSRSLDFGTGAVQAVKAGKEDRNRTAPFPFCGNRFEFRAVGAQQNIAFPLFMLNTAMADSLATLADRIEGGEKAEDAVRNTFKENIRVIFNGNGYSEEWRAEADKRGLWHLKTAPDAIPHLVSKKNIDLFTKHGVLTESSLRAREDIMYKDYIETIMLETTTLLEMIYSWVAPGIISDVTAGKALGTHSSKSVNAYVNGKVKLLDQVLERTDELKKLHEDFPEHASPAEQAKYCRDKLKTQMLSVRDATDTAEKVIGHAAWPFPKYDELLYIHHPESDIEA